MSRSIECAVSLGISVEMAGLPMAGETPIVGTPPVAAPPARELAPKAGQASGDPKPAAPTATAAAQPPPPSFPVTLQFDQDTHRFFIEARDSSGLVVLQIPFKAAVSATTGSGSSSTRGQRVNSEA